MLKRDKDIRYLRAISAVIMAAELNRTYDGDASVTFEEIKKVYVKIGIIPENFASHPAAYYTDLALGFKKSMEIQRGEYNAYA